MVQKIVTHVGITKITYLQGGRYWIDAPGHYDASEGKLGSLSQAIGDAVLINSIRAIGSDEDSQVGPVWRGMAYAMRDEQRGK